MLVFRVNLNCLFKYPTGEIEKPAGNSSLELRGKSWSGDTKLG